MTTRPPDGPERPDEPAGPGEVRGSGTASGTDGAPGASRTPDAPDAPGVEPGEPSGPRDEVLAVLPRMAQLSNALTRGRVSERAMEAAGVTVERPALSVLLNLHVVGRPLRIKDIAERAQVVQPHVTRLVQELERRGMVRRIGDPADRRASLIEPTAEGSATADRYARTLVGWFTRAVDHWPEQDRREFGRLLERFVDDATAFLTTLGDGEAPPPSA